MGINKDANRRASRVVADLDSFTDSQLKKLNEALRLETRRRQKGGGWQDLNRDELSRSIRSQVGQGTFADTLNRFVDLANGFFEYTRGEVDVVFNAEGTAESEDVDGIWEVFIKDSGDRIAIVSKIKIGSWMHFYHPARKATKEYYVEMRVDALFSERRDHDHHEYRDTSTLGGFDTLNEAVGAIESRFKKLHREDIEQEQNETHDNIK